MAHVLIRYATAQDIPSCLEMGAKFHATASLSIAFDPPTFTALLGELIRAKYVLVLADKANEPVGMIAMATTPAFYNRHVLIAIEAFWWIEPEHRGHGGKMIDALEKRAKRTGAVTLDFASRAALKSVGRLYERKGYKLTTNNYIKVL